MSARAKRAGRLVDLAHRQVQAAEFELARAVAEAAAADAAVVQADAAVEAARKQPLDVTTAGDLEDAFRRDAWLRELARRARVAAAERHAEVKRGEQLLVERRTAERRVEMMLERIQSLETERLAKNERRAADEHAARTVTRGKTA